MSFFCPAHFLTFLIQQLDATASSSVSFLVCSEHPSKRLIISPTGMHTNKAILRIIQLTVIIIGPINRDFDDARRFYDAGLNGIIK